jgi:2-polyprenyl-6-methoxyphenol hydroxylase-like FAD-dependent oxidoreductase
MAEILVVGGGIGGLTFGAAARRLGIEVEIVERLGSAATGAAGIGLHVNAQRALAKIGLADPVEAVAVLDGSFRAVDAAGRELAIVDYEAVWGGPTWSVHRADLNAALQSGVRADQLLLGVGVTDVRVGADRVEVTFSDGSRGAYDLVIGADGVHSVVRASVVGGGLERYGGACFWRTTLPEEVVDRRTAVVHDGLTVGLSPLVGNRSHAFFQMRADDVPDDPIEGRAQRVRERYRGMGSLVSKALELLPGDEDIHFGVLEWVDPPTWGVGRVVLIGDAAHSMAPPLALGGAMAIEDAIVLAEELGNTPDTDIAISHFIARREPRVAFVLERTRITWARNRGERPPGEPTDEDAFNRRNFAPLLADP